MIDEAASESDFLWEPAIRWNAISLRLHRQNVIALFAPKRAQVEAQLRGFDAPLASSAYGNFGHGLPLVLSAVK